MKGFKTVVIIGAARSGTNLLRDVAAGFPQFATWPCDEINYIWRYGNRSWPDDEFGPELAHRHTVRYIRAAFERIACRSRASTIVEKTCANSLRVEFVDRVLPECRYIFIVRDGRDVVASALKRWTAPLEPAYLLAKARYVPVKDLPYYGSRYLANRLYRLVSGKRRLAFWGPQFPGIKDVLRTKSLAEVAALQWVRCVERAEEAFRRIDPSRVHRLRYEEFVQDPHAEIRRFAEFLEVDLAPGTVQSAAERVSAKSVGKWRSELDDQTKRLVEPYLAPVLERLGYAAA